ncbi:hypothetical protein [Enterococcus dispar]|uniref:hypothetical protein n=1 Tax=Enterococcus dispar TaxID=44009 RepID=UPI0028925C58|nr:hypothetical protein [Enterococcus dispar]MDT2704815.1 hypothetical protein [Enterococcus dispar]
MVSPKEVISPKEKLELLHIIEDGTITGKGYSIAKLKWKSAVSYGIRYDGDDEKDKGFPTTGKGYQAAWFILPDAVAYPYLRTLVAQKDIDYRLESFTTNTSI